jgi:hypothetical protein
MAAADLNGDGHPDVVAVNAVGDPDPATGARPGGTISVLLGVGDGTFQPALSYPTDLDPTAVLVADVNQDHVPDLVVTAGPSYPDPGAPSGPSAVSGG